MTKREDAVAPVRAWLLGLQQRIVDALEAEDGQGKFLRDEWAKAPGERLQGEGITRIGVVSTTDTGKVISGSRGRPVLNVTWYPPDVCGASSPTATEST